MKAQLTVQWAAQHCMSHVDSLGGRAHSCERKWTAKRAGARNYKVLINWVQKEA